MLLDVKKIRILLDEDLVGMKGSVRIGILGFGLGIQTCWIRYLDPGKNLVAKFCFGDTPQLQTGLVVVMFQLAPMPLA